MSQQFKLNENDQNIVYREFKLKHIFVIELPLQAAHKNIQDKQYRAIHE